MKAAFIILSCLAITAFAQWNQPSRNPPQWNQPTWNQPPRNQPSRRPATCPGCRNPNFPQADIPDWCPPCVDDPMIPFPPQPTTCGANCNVGNRRFLWPHSDSNMFWQCRPTVEGGFESVERLCACPTLFDFGLQRCVHLHEWTRQCNQQPTFATPRQCPACPDCGPNEPLPTPPPVENCPCVCNICIMWPCTPCPSNCCRQ